MSTDTAPAPADTIATTPFGRRRRGAVVVALLCGIGLYVVAGERGRWTAGQLIPFAAAAVLAVIPATRRAAERLLDAVRRADARSPAATALVMTGLALVVLALPPLVRGSDAFYPRSHDEQMHMVQVRALAAGRLWLPPHPQGEFFETFFVLHEPVYASIYFPGASLLFTPMAWLGLPYWLLPAVYSALAVGFAHRVFARLIDSAAGLLAAMLLLSSTMFRALALGTISHNVMLLLGLLMIWAWLRWLERPRAGRAAALGVVAGLAAITRPVDALCYAMPLAVIAIMTLARMKTSARGVAIASVLAGAAPAVALQVAFNVGVTGRVLQSPYQFYLDTQQPGTSYGFYPPDSDFWPQSNLVQKHVYYHQFIRPSVEKHRPERVAATFVTERLPLLLVMALPHPLAAAILPVGLLGLTCWRRAAVFAVLLMLIMAYALNPFLLSHYLVIWMPPVVLLILLGLAVLERARSGVTRVSAAGALFVVAAVVSAQPGINPNDATRSWRTPVLDDVHRKLGTLPHKPAVVFFRYDPRTTYNEEPVYTTDTTWPDDAPVVRAHDLGPQNVELVRYYAARQPERFYYLYDIASRTLTPLGRADELLDPRPPASQPATRPSP